MAPASNSRRVALVALFTALALVLNLVVSVPAPYADFLFYEVWEIPVVVALLVLGFWGGSTVAVLNALALELAKPGALPTGPVYNLIAEVSMFLGLLAVQRVSSGRAWSKARLVVAATGAGVLSRTAVMTLVNGVILPLPYPVGFGSFGVTEAQVPALLVLIGVFNFTVALYTIPLAYSVERAIASRLRLYGLAAA
ncbi:MAG: hypothetical protein LYZ70_03325 [Nitrososphaerales archaeon]|nr:hypothetical protein [Nitrososphaerales archaeon]